MRKKFPLFLIAFFLFSLVKTPAVRAAQEPDTYNGVDIVFLVDQSGSMSGLCNSCPFNDPLDLRFYSLSYAMKWMGENYIGVDSNKMPFNVAIVNFGSSVEPWDFDPSNDQQYWQEIAPVSQSEWDTLYKKLEADIGEMTKKYKKKSLGDTDFKPAFERAKLLFSEEYLPATDGENHRHVIVVLTDGQPNPDYQSKDYRVTDYMHELGFFTRDNFAEPDYRIYVIGMPDEHDPYWSRVRPNWEAITDDPCPGPNPFCQDVKKDRASLVASNQEVGNHFLNLLLDLTDIKEPTITPGKNILPPYLKTAIFTLFKDDNKERLMLTDPNGKVVDGIDPHVQVTGQDGPIEVVRIDAPMPGEWQVVTQPANENVIITKREIYAQSRLDSPLSAQMQYLPVKIQYTLLDEAGDPLPYYGPEYPLAVEAEIQSGGQKWPLTLKDVQSGNVYEASFTPVVVGEHILVVRASSKDIAGQIVEVYKGSIGSFTVSKAVLVPTNLSASWPQYETRDLIFELRNENGYPVSNATGTSEIKVVGGATIGGSPDGDQFSLALQNDGTYKGSYAPQLQGEHVLHVLGTIRDSNGDTHVITDSDVGKFGVDPTTKVVLKLIQPANPVSSSGNIFEENNTDAWSFTRTPLTIQVGIVDDKGSAIPLARAFKDPDKPLLLELEDKDGHSISSVLDFKLDDVTGLFNAETTELGIGEYHLKIKGAELNPGYVYEENADEVPIQITRVINPWLINAGLALLLFLVVTVPTSTGVVMAKARRKQHPCRGRIYVVDGFGSHKFEEVLETKNSNRITYHRSEINQITKIRQISVECKTEADSKASRVDVKIWVDKDEKPILNAASLGPHSRKRIGTTQFWLLKDPDEDQWVDDSAGDQS